MSIKINDIKHEKRRFDLRSFVGKQFAYFPKVHKATGSNRSVKENKVNA